MNIQLADRINRLPPYLFAEIEKAMKEKKAQGADLISLSIGDPDLPPPPFVIAVGSLNLLPHNLFFLSWGLPHRHKPHRRIVFVFRIPCQTRRGKTGRYLF